MKKSTINAITTLVATGFLTRIGEKLAEKSIDLFKRVFNKVTNKILGKRGLSKEVDQDYLDEIKAVIVDTILAQTKKMEIEVGSQDLDSEIDNIAVDIGDELKSMKNKEDLMKALRAILRKSERYLDKQQNSELSRLIIDAHMSVDEIADSDILEEIDRVGKILGAKQKIITKRGVFIEAKRDVEIDRSTIVGRDLIQIKNKKSNCKTLS